MDYKRILHLNLLFEERKFVSKTDLLFSPPSHGCGKML